MTRFRGFGMVVIVAVLAWGPTARADERDAAFGLGKQIVEAAHFTGVKHKLRDYSVSSDRMTIEIDWRGGFLDTPYTSTIKVKFKQIGGKVKIESIDYKDDAIIAYSRPSIDRLIRNFNDD